MQVCTSLQTDNHASTPLLSFLQAGCPSCRPTNSVKALKANNMRNNLVKYCCYNHIKTKASSSCLVRHTAWKQVGPSDTGTAQWWYNLSRCVQLMTRKLPVDTGSLLPQGRVLRVHSIFHLHQPMICHQYPATHHRSTETIKSRIYKVSPMFTFVDCEFWWNRVPA